VIVSGSSSGGLADGDPIPAPHPNTDCSERPSVAAAEPVSRRATASNPANASPGTEKKPSSRNGVARTRTKAPSTTAKAGTSPAAGADGDAEGGPRVEFGVDPRVDIETGPAAEDLADVEVEDIAVDAEEAEAPSGPGAEDFVWDEE
jgi:hypothetical protein